MPLSTNKILALIRPKLYAGRQVILNQPFAQLNAEKQNKFFEAYSKLNIKHKNQFLALQSPDDLIVFSQYMNHQRQHLTADKNKKSIRKAQLYEEEQSHVQTIFSHRARVELKKNSFEQHLDKERFIRQFLHLNTVDKIDVLNVQSTNGLKSLFNHLEQKKTPSDKIIIESASQLIQSIYQQRKINEAQDRFFAHATNYMNFNRAQAILSSPFLIGVGSINNIETSPTQKDFYRLTASTVQGQGSMLVDVQKSIIQDLAQRQILLNLYYQSYPRDITQEAKQTRAQFLNDFSLLDPDRQNQVLTRKSPDELNAMLTSLNHRKLDAEKAHDEIEVASIHYLIANVADHLDRKTAEEKLNQQLPFAYDFLRENPTYFKQWQPPPFYNFTGIYKDQQTGKYQLHFTHPSQYLIKFGIKPEEIESIAGLQIVNILESPFRKESANKFLQDLLSLPPASLEEVLKRKTVEEVLKRKTVTELKAMEMSLKSQKETLPGSEKSQTIKLLFNIVKQHIEQKEQENTHTPYAKFPKR